MRTPQYDRGFMGPYGEVTDVADCRSTSYRRIYSEMVEVDLRFRDQVTFRQFKEDLWAGRKANAEEYIRENNPAVKRAWEEYQILLKLLK